MATHTPTNPTPVLEFGSYLRLYIHSNQEPAHGRGSYLAGYFLNTQLSPLLVAKCACDSATQNDIIQPYSDLTQSLYFKIETIDGTQVRRGVEFGEEFRLVPSNSLTGAQVSAVFDHLVPGSSETFGEHRFTFTKSTQQPQNGPSTPLFGSAFSGPSLQQVQHHHNGNGNLVHYNVPNVTLNIMRLPPKASKGAAMVVTPIEFAKDKSSHISGGFFTTQKDVITTPKSDPILTKPVTFTIKSATDPILSVQVYESTPKGTSGAVTTTTHSKTGHRFSDIDSLPPFTLDASSVGGTTIPPQPSLPSGKLLSDVPIHAFHQNHIVYTGTDYDKTLVIALRDVGKVTLSMESLCAIPMNPFYNRIAPPTTGSEFCEWDDEGHDKYLEKEIPRFSVLKTLKLHGAQLSIDLPIRVTKIVAGSEVTLVPFTKGKASDSFCKLPLPQPSPILTFAAVFALAYQIFNGLETDLFQSEPLTLARYLAPFIILLITALFYPRFFVANAGHSMKCSTPTPAFHYIVQFLQPQDASTHRDVVLAFASPSPLILQNSTINLGTVTPIPYSTAVFDQIQSRTYNDAKDLMTANQQYQADVQIQKNRPTIDADALPLFQILDTIRSSTFFADGDLSPLCHTLPQHSYQQLDEYLNKNTVMIKDQPTTLRSVLKTINKSGPTPQTIAALITHNKDVGYKLLPAHSSGKPCEVKLYYPFIFKAIQLAHQITPSDFINAWTYGLNNLPARATGAGRSGALFMLSSCCKYIFKTMNKADMGTLHSLISDYGSYITTHSSLLMRLLGVYRVIGPDGKKQYFLVANNAFYLPPQLTSNSYKLVSKYDLKGRTPKRDAKDRRTEADASVWKDLQLSRVFSLHDNLRQQVVDNIETDVEFLKAHDCIDYSLLVGVGENQSLASQIEHNDGENSQPTQITFAPTLTPADIETNCQRHRSVGIPPYIPSQDSHLEVFCVAIVDFLARYDNAMKKGAHAFKSLRWKDEELSTVNSQFYGQRFSNYVKVVFPPVGAVLVRNKEELENYFQIEAQQQLSSQSSTSSSISQQPQQQTPYQNPFTPQQTGIAAVENNTNTNPSIQGPTISFATPRKSIVYTSPLVLSPSQQISVSPEAKKIADLSLSSLPESTLRALEPGARSPGSMLVTRSGKHVVILPTGVDSAPKSIIERSKLGYGTSDLSRYVTSIKSVTNDEQQ